MSRLGALKSDQVRKKMAAEREAKKEERMRKEMRRQSALLSKQKRAVEAYKERKQPARGSTTEAQDEVRATDLVPGDKILVPTNFEYPNIGIVNLPTKPVLNEAGTHYLETVLRVLVTGMVGTDPWCEVTILTEANMIIHSVPESVTFKRQLESAPQEHATVGPPPVGISETAYSKDFWMYPQAMRDGDILLLEVHRWERLHRHYASPIQNQPVFSVQDNAYFEVLATYEGCKQLIIPDERKEGAVAVFTQNGNALRLDVNTMYRIRRRKDNNDASVLPFP